MVRGWTGTTRWLTTKMCQELKHPPLRASNACVCFVYSGDLGASPADVIGLQSLDLCGTNFGHENAAHMVDRSKDEDEDDVRDGEGHKTCLCKAMQKSCSNKQPMPGGLL